MVLYHGFIWFVTLLYCYGDYSHTRIPTQIVTLLNENSYANYKPVKWNYTGDGSQLILPIRFRTRSVRGRLITLSAKGNTKESNIFTLYAYIDNAAIIVDLIGSEGKVIKKTERQLPGANNGLEHSMSIHLNPETKILKMVYGQGTVDSYDFIDNLKTENEMYLNIRTGSYEDKNSIIGCVVIVGLTIGSRFVFEFGEKAHFIAIRDDCDTLCEDGQCNEGNCVDLFHSTICDCRGTYRSGETCNEDMKTLNISWDQYISYKIAENDSQPIVISIDFKTEVKEGVIIVGTILSLENNQKIFGKLKLALSNEQLKLTIANFAEITFDNVILDPNKYNQISLEFDYGLSIVQMIFNDNIKSANLNINGKESYFRFGNELLFFAGDGEIGGLSGCLRGIYVGYVDVIDGYVRNSPKINGNAEVRSCEETTTIRTINESVLIREKQLNEKKQSLNKYTKQHKKHEYEYEAGQVVIESDHVPQYDTRNESVMVEQADEHYKQVQQEQERLKAEEELQAVIGDVVITSEAPAKQLCENDEATSCKNSIECIHDGRTPICVCRNGFIGKYCQFSLLPWNCDEVFNEGNTISGTYIIDTDGSGPLPVTYAYCEQGKTIIPHNMPNHTLIHSKDLGDIHMIVNYKLFNDALLESLKNRSQSCKQTVRYDCRAAPLNFNTLKTWFASTSNEFFVGFGGMGGTCPCFGSNCSKCNCDDGGIGTDFGIMEGLKAPIRSIYSLNDPTDGEGYLLLGPLICSGTVGRTNPYTMIIRKRYQLVEIGSWNGESLSFEFRTYLENATLLSSNEKKLEIVMTERTLQLFFDNQTILTIIPQSRKNDGHWHKIIVDIRDGSIRFSVDKSVVTAEIQQPSFTKTNLYIGGGKDGFLGCVRQVYVNDKLQEAEQSLQGGCINQCLSHDCQHQSRCMEDFATNSVLCVCKNNIVQYGDLCQNSINYGTEISFHDMKKAFLKAQNPAVHNALMQRIVFSFRTDRRDALLIYLHDQLYNFLQVHLTDHSRMVLTLNFNRTIQRCEVVAEVGNEFSQMKWIQVMIFQWHDRVELNVDDEICQISGQRTLSVDFIKKFEITSDMYDVVEPPVSPVVQDGAVSHSYVLLFVGGVPTVNYHGSLNPIYRSSIPNLLGCFRGLLIGTKLFDMRDRTYWMDYSIENDMINYGCQTGCQKIEHLCKNGGHCSVQWTAKYIDEVASCNCARTSYFGEHCDQDNGAYFAGNSILIFNTSEIFEKVIYDWSEIGEHTLSFAFSTTTSMKPLKPQALVSIHFDDNRIMEIVLCKNGSINVGIKSKVASYVYTFPHSYDDGYRHYFQAIFHGNKPLKITIDSWKYTFPEKVAILPLVYTSKISFGGGLRLMDDLVKYGSKKRMKFNFTGCISNIDINMNVARMHFKPILYLQKTEVEFAEAVNVLGDELQFGACNSFLIPGNLPPLLNIVTSPTWDSPFTVERYVKSDADDEHVPISDEKSEWWVIIMIISSSLLIIAIILMILCFFKTKRRQSMSLPSAPKNNDNGSADHENLPLLPNNDDKKAPLSIKDDFDLPEPDQHLDEIQLDFDSTNIRNSTDLQPAVPTHTLPHELLTKQSPGSKDSSISGRSSQTAAYFTANSSFDSDNEQLAYASQASNDQSTLVAVIEDDNTMIVDMYKCDGTVPECLSSYKSTYLTAPPYSPLYKPPIARKPKPVATPCSPTIRLN